MVLMQLCQKKKEKKSNCKDRILENMQIMNFQTQALNYAFKLGQKIYIFSIILGSSPQSYNDPLRLRRKHL